VTDKEYEEMIAERDRFIADLQAENAKLKGEIEEEREACALIADQKLNQDALCVSGIGVVGATEAGLIAFRIAREIRARSEEKGALQTEELKSD
jgi:hypothetical protein